MTDLPQRVSCVVFDCDGVLVDTEPLWEEAEQELMARYGTQLTPADRGRLLGSSWEPSLRVLAERAGTSDLDKLGAELTAIAGEKLRTQTRPLPGAVEVLEALAGRVPLGIGSNAKYDDLHAELRSAGLADYADVIISYEEVTRPKPAGDVYAEVCRRLAGDPDAAIGVEDSATGVRALREAGISVLAIPTLASHDIDHDWLRGSLTDVLDWARTVQPIGR